MEESTFDSPVDYGFKVVIGDPGLCDLGWSGYVGHPFIFDGRPGYAALPNAFLIDRRLGVWDPVGRGTRRDVPLSRQSLVSYAHWLCNALEWSEARGVDLLQADYTSELLARYQREMLSGVWSSSMKGLSPATVNLRVQAVVEYQVWASDKGLRSPVAIPTITRTIQGGSAFSSRGHEARTVEARKGKLRVEKKPPRFPSDDWIGLWKKQVADRPGFGKTEALIADLILHTGIRVSEAAGWRVDTLPIDKGQWEITNPDQAPEHHLVSVSLKYGTKGPDLFEDHGDKVGKPETIKVPRWLCERLNQYYETTRPISLKPALARAKTAAAQKAVLARSVHLFIHPVTGERYTASLIQYFWNTARKAVPQPCQGKWSPHSGRHYWACKYLKFRMKEHAELVKRALNVQGMSMDHPIMASLKDTAMTVIMTEIKPQLRHVRLATTEVYLQWLMAEMGVAMDFRAQWLADDSDDDENEET
jgi:integrase